MCVCVQEMQSLRERVQIMSAAHSHNHKHEKTVDASPNSDSLGDLPVASEKLVGTNTAKTYLHNSVAPDEKTFGSVEESAESDEPGSRSMETSHENEEDAYSESDSNDGSDLWTSGAETESGFARQHSASTADASEAIDASQSDVQDSWE